MTPIILADNRFRDATPVANLTATGYDVRRLCDDRAYTVWVGAGVSPHYISVDCGAGKKADALGVIGHNFKTIGATLAVQASDNGSDWSAIASDIKPASDRAFLKTFDTATHRYWRLAITGMSSAPRIGEVYLGERITVPMPPAPPYTPYTAEVEADTTVGKAGHILGSVIRHTRLAITARFENLDRTWVFGTFQTFWETRAAKLLPWFWAWDLDAFSQHVFFVTAKDPARWATPLSIHTLVDTLTLEMVGVMEA